MSHAKSQTNIENYKDVQVESQLFRDGWTAVVYFEGGIQRIACVAAASEAISIALAKSFVDNCYGAFAS